MTRKPAPADLVATLRGCHGGRDPLLRTRPYANTPLTMSKSPSSSPKREMRANSVDVRDLEHRLELHVAGGRTPRSHRGDSGQTTTWEAGVAGVDLESAPGESQPERKMSNPSNLMLQYTQQAISRRVTPYLSELIKNYDASRSSDFFAIHSHFVEIRPFEVAQEPLIALFDGNCPIANCRVGACRISFPTPVSLSEHLNLMLTSFECDLLPFPDILPKDTVHEIMSRMLGGRSADPNHSPGEINLPDASSETEEETKSDENMAAAARTGASALRADWRFKTLTFLEGPVTLALMLTIVCLGILFSVIGMPSADESPAMAGFEYGVTMLFAIELCLRARCYTFVHGKLFPDFCRDPFTCIDIAVVAIDLLLMATAVDIRGLHKLARASRLLRMSRFSKFHRVARSARVLTAVKMWRKNQMNKALLLLRQKNLGASVGYGRLARMTDECSVSVSSFKIHMVEPTEAGLCEWLGVPMGDTRPRARPSVEGSNPPSPSSTSDRREPSLLFASLRKKIMMSKRDSHRVVTQSEDEKKNPTEFKSSTVVEVKGLHLVDVETCPSENAGVRRPSVGAMVQIVKMLTARVCSVYSVDSHAMRAPILRPVPLEVRLTLHRRKVDAALVDLEVDAALPRTIAAVLAGLPSLPIKLRFGQQSTVEDPWVGPVFETSSNTAMEDRHTSWFKEAAASARSNLIWTTLYESLRDDQTKW